MKLAIITAIPIEFRSANKILSLRAQTPCLGCRLGAGRNGDVEIVCVQTGPGKIRSTQGTASLIGKYEPDLVLDTGTCAGIGPELLIGDIILAGRCYEFDMENGGLPVKKIKAMPVASAFHFLPEASRKNLERRAQTCGEKTGVRMHEGGQAAGELLINSLAIRKRLYDLYRVEGANWETAGVFISSLRASRPALSLRVVSDLGDGQALAQFRRSARRAADGLYLFIRGLIESGWCGGLLKEWRGLPASLVTKMPHCVRP